MYMYTLQKIYACLKNFIVFFFHILFCTIQVEDKITIFSLCHIYIYIYILYTLQKIPELIK
jgi:hypothetical protein